MNKKSDNIFENKLSAFEYLIEAVFFCICIYLYFVLREFFYPTLIALLWHATWIKKISLTKTTITIKYPFIPYIEKKFRLNEIERITFKSNNAAANPEVLVIRMKGGRKSRNYFSGGKEFQVLINLLRDRGINVEVISHIWK